MLFVEIILKNLRQRFTRTIFTIVGLAVAVTAITTLWTATWGYATSANSFYSARGVDIVVVRAGVSNRLTSNLHIELADRIRALPGVGQVDGSLTEMVSLGQNHLVGIPLRGYLPGSSTLSDLTIRDGHSLEEHSLGTVLLGSALADALNKKPGQELEIEGTRFPIVGVFQADNPFDSNSIIAPLADVQKLMGRPGIISEIHVRARSEARDETSLRQLCQTIESLQSEQHEPHGLKAQRTHDFVDSASEAKLSGAMAAATTAIVAVLSFIGMLNAMLMSVLERTKELGVLRAVGWTRSRLMQMIIGEGVVLGAAGALFGIAAALLLLIGLRHWSVTALLVPNNVSLQAVSLALAACFASTVVGSLYPSFHASRVPPIESLRHE